MTPTPELLDSLASELPPPELRGGPRDPEALKRVRRAFVGLLEAEHKSMADMLGITLKELKTYDLRAGRGCPTCFHTGYLGRTGIFEIFDVSDALRVQIMHGDTEEQLRQAAVEQGLVPLKVAGLNKIKNGVTTVDEFVRVLG